MLTKSEKMLLQKIIQIKKKYEIEKNKKDMQIEKTKSEHKKIRRFKIKKVEKSTIST